MKDVLKTYDVILHADGPVYVGNGLQINKKEYITQLDGSIWIMSPEKLYAKMVKKGKRLAYEDYLLKNNRDDLFRWLKSQQIRTQEVRDCIKYILSCKELLEDRKDRSRLQIFECIKDPYGKPYIPGSSIKGMLRTILLGSEIISVPDMILREKEQMTNRIFADDRNSFHKGDKKLVEKEIKQMEENCFRKLNRPETKPFDAVNDVLQGLIVSDSEPLELENLTLCQAYELHADGAEKTLNILRESIKPGTDIKFTITVDSSVCSYTREDIIHAISVFSDQINTNFGKKFTAIDRMKDNQVLLGGGAGFLSKTVTYPIYGKVEGIRVVKKIFEKTGVPRNHKHENDIKLGASPHIMKCTRYNGKLYKMGLCTFKI